MSRQFVLSMGQHFCRGPSNFRSRLGNGKRRALVFRCEEFFPFLQDERMGEHFIHMFHQNKFNLFENFLWYLFYIFLVFKRKQYLADTAAVRGQNFLFQASYGQLRSFLSVLQWEGPFLSGLSHRSWQYHDLQGYSSAQKQ